MRRKPPYRGGMLEGEHRQHTAGCLRAPSLHAGPFGVFPLNSRRTAPAPTLEELDQDSVDDFEGDFWGVGLLTDEQLDQDAKENDDEYFDD